MDVTFVETKKGKGFKIVVDGQWHYASKKALFNAINKKHGCKFRKFEEFVKSEETNAN